MSNGTRDNGKVLQDILIHVGKTSEGISNLKTDVKEVKDHLSRLNHSTVRKPECTERHVVVAQSVDAVRTELKGSLEAIEKDIKHIRRSTNLRNQTVSGVYTGADEAPPDEDSASGRGLRHWLGVGTGIITILVFLGSLAWGVFRIGRYMERVDQMVQTAARSQMKLHEEIREAAKNRRVVYVKAPQKQEPEPRPEPQPRKKRRPPRR